MIRITEVVKQILLLNITIFIIFHVIFPNLEHYIALYFPTSEHFKFWQPLTHMFMHANFSHIFFNMIGLVFFGSYLESVWGPGKFLKYYLICGVGSLVLQLAYWYYSGNPMINEMAMVGASGAIMGCVMGMAVVNPNQVVYLLFPPIPIKVVYIAILYFLSDVFMGFGKTGGNIANFGHIGGAITGFIITMYWRYSGTIHRR